MDRRRLWDIVAIVSLLVFIAWGQWEVLLGKRQPVGGDKTAFFFGLMAVYDRCLSEGTLPFWNELWGFGFPGVAESQVGAFYPLHLVLYGLLPAFSAFRWNLLLHRLLAVPLCFLSLRRCGLATRGAWLGTLMYIGGGFAVGHGDHQWALEAMIWLPPVFACTHRWIWHGSRVSLLCLPPLLALQLSIGHFQIAFMTVTMCLCYVLAAAWRQRHGTDELDVDASPDSHDTQMTQNWTGVALHWKTLGWLAAVALGFVMAGAQLLPTAHLAAYIRSVNPTGASVDYLSTHAQPPWLTANLAFPYLYFREPLWRDVFWTPLRTAPEECLAYVGLLPLCLAVAGAWQRRRDRRVWCWVLVGLIALLLSFGPYVPWFSLLVKLPGFSFFRSAARWGIVVQFVLAILAGYAFDRLQSPAPLVRCWWKFLLLLCVLAALIAGWWWLIDRGARSVGSAPGWMNRLAEWTIPWSDGGTADAMVRQAGTRRLWDAYTQRYWLSLGRPARPMRLIDVWPEVLRHEVYPSLLAIFVTSGCLMATAFASRRFTFRWHYVVAAICVADLALFQAIFPDRTAPVTQLRPDGPLLQAVGDIDPGRRIVTPGGNLLQAWGVAPVPSYRTLDIPYPAALSALLDAPATVQWQLPPNSLVDLGAILEHPAVADTSERADEETTFHTDEQLDWWLDGNSDLRALIQQRRPEAAVGSILRKLPVQAGAVLIPGRPEVESQGEVQIDVLRQSPKTFVGTVERKESGGTHRRWHVVTPESSLLVIGELYLPGWSAKLTSPSGQTVSTWLVRVDQYWQGVVIPKPGEYEVQLAYSAPEWGTGLAGSAVGWGVWLAAVAFCYRSVRRRRSTPATAILR